MRVLKAFIIIEVVVRSKPFQVAPLQLAYVSVYEYARQFWWYVSIVPFFGLLMLVFGRGVLQGAGMMGLLWPVSLPVRALFASRKSRKLFGSPTQAEFKEDGVYFHPESGKGLRLDRGSIRTMYIRKEWVVLSTRMLHFIPIPREALADADLESLSAWAKEAYAGVEE